MHTDSPHALTSDELTAADRLFAELLAERDPQSPIVDLGVHAETARTPVSGTRIVAAAS